MGYMDIANSGLLYIGVFAGLGVVVLFCALFYVKTRRHALELGATKETLNKVVKSALVFTFIPSLAIAVGLFALAGVVGAPWADFRLSIIGSLNYELNSANIAAGAMGFASVNEAANMDGSVFGTIMFIMSLGIIAPPIINGIVSKTLTTRLQGGGNGGDSFIPVMNTCFMIAIWSLYIPIYLVEGLPSALVVITALVIAGLINKISSVLSLEWLKEFNMPLALLGGMASSILWTSL